MIDWKQFDYMEESYIRACLDEKYPDDPRTSEPAYRFRRISDGFMYQPTEYTLTEANERASELAERAKAPREYADRTPMEMFHIGRNWRYSQHTISKQYSPHFELSREEYDAWKEKGGVAATDSARQARYEQLVRERTPAPAPGGDGR